MKLNNKGFSLNTMIVLISVLLFTVLLVSVLAYHYQHNIETDTMLVKVSKNVKN